MIRDSDRCIGGVDGQTGTDTADYSDATNGVNVNLQIGLANDGIGGTDKLIAVENILGDGDINDKTR